MIKYGVDLSQHQGQNIEVTNNHEKSNIFILWSVFKGLYIHCRVEHYIGQMKHNHHTSRS